MPEHTAASIPMSWTNGATTVAVEGVLTGIRPLPNHGPLILEIRVERDAMVRRRPPTPTNPTTPHEGVDCISEES